MLTVAAQDAVDGTPFGRYRLLSMLGEGGMGEVWRARHTVIDRVVAIKLLPQNLSKDEDFQRRFRREAHAAARLETPHVVPIYDYGEVDGRLFFSMRLIKGRDLATRSLTARWNQLAPCASSTRSPKPCMPPMRWG